MFEQLGLIGCGLMGGSFALALKDAGLVKRVVGFSPSTTTLQKALQLGVIDEAAASPGQAATGADIVLVAVPVSATEATLQAIGWAGTNEPICPPRARWAAASTSLLVEPTSMINICGVTAGRIACRVASVADTGTATSTMSAPVAACLGEAAASSMTPSCRAFWRVVVDELKPTTRCTRPASLSAKANEPPIRPQPIKPSW